MNEHRSKKAKRTENWRAYQDMRRAAGDPNVPRRDDSRYEPDHSKRCNDVLVRGKVFCVCNRRQGHQDEHERWSYTGVRVDVWPRH